MNRAGPAQGGPQFAIALDLVAVLRDWSRSVRAMAGSRERVEVVSGRTACPHTGDPRALHGALIHLANDVLHRARRTRGPRPVIRLQLVDDRLDDGAEAVAFVVGDLGGREPSELDRLAGHLGMAPAHPANHADLDLARAIARAHGGDLRVAAAGTEGGELRLVLPLRGAGNEDAQHGPLALLLVGGDRLSLEHSAQGLRALGHRTEACPSVAAALRRLGEGAAFAAVVADATLGGAALARLTHAARSASRPTRVVVLDGLDRGDTQRTPPGAVRGDLVLRKPCGAWDLIHAIRLLRSGADPVTVAGPGTGAAAGAGPQP